jgi:Uma2 family endonuclease
MSAFTAVQTTPLPDSIASLSLYRFTVDEYERMSAVLDEPRVELIDGYVMNKMGKKPPHIWSVGRILKALEFLPKDQWTCRKEDPVRIPDFDEPEPDIAVIRGPEDQYQDRIPEARDVALLVEVAESTLERDRGKKLSAYAKGGIPIYWIVNLVERQIEVYSNPSPTGYASRTDFAVGDHVAIILDGVEISRIAVESILPIKAGN